MKKAIFPLLIAVMAFACESKKEQGGQAPETSPAAEASQPVRTSDLPPIPVAMVDGSTRQLKQLKGKTVLVLFQPACDHCQREANEIREHLDNFQDYQVYFISSAELAEIQQFAIDYKLSDETNFHFGTTSAVNVVNSFGSIPTPSLYIYSADGQLITDFKGETPIEKILEAL